MKRNKEKHHKDELKITNKEKQVTKKKVKLTVNANGNPYRLYLAIVPGFARPITHVDTILVIVVVL